jgi:hypothetical protein
MARSVSMTRFVQLAAVGFWRLLVLEAVLEAQVK